MAIALDATAVGNAASPTVTWAHTCTGSNLILFVGIGTDTGGGDTVTGVTYNAIAMTQIDKQLYSGSTGYVYLYYLLNPATGSNNVVVSISSGVGRCDSVSYTGVKQSAQPDASGKNTAAAVTSLTTSVTTVADNCWMISMAQADSAVPTASTGVTSRASNNVNDRMGDSNGVITPAGSYSMTYTLPSGKIATVQASFSPAPAVVAAPQGYAMFL